MVGWGRSACPKLRVIESELYWVNGRFSAPLMVPFIILKTYFLSVRPSVALPERHVGRILTGKGPPLLLAATGQHELCADA